LKKLFLLPLGCALAGAVLFSCVFIAMLVMTAEALPEPFRAIALAWVLGKSVDDSMVARTQIKGNNAPYGWPVDGPISASFHDPAYFDLVGREHDGVDIVAPKGTPVYATMDGCAVVANWQETGYGWLVVLDSASFMTYYAHLNGQPAVRPGQCVKRGALLGYVGNSGFVIGGPGSDGSHLHYAIWYYGEGWMNPRDFLLREGPPASAVGPRTGTLYHFGPPAGFDVWALLNAPVQTANASGDVYMPKIEGQMFDGGFSIADAHIMDIERSHFNTARVQGFVLDPSGYPIAGIPMRVCWSGGCVNTATRSNGYYEVILGKGTFRVYVNNGGNQPWGQVGVFQTDLPGDSRYGEPGHYTYVINFMGGSRSG